MNIQRLAVVVNPQGGRKRGLRVLESVKPTFATAGIAWSIHVTQRSGHAAEIAQSLAKKSCDAICVIGGDGTFHEVADGLMRREEPVSIPCTAITGTRPLAFSFCLKHGAFEFLTQPLVRLSIQTS